MHAEADITSIVREWLRAEGDASGAHVVERVLAILDTPVPVATPVPVSPAARRRASGTLAGFVLVAAAVIVVAVAGRELWPAGAGVGGQPAATPSATPAATSVPSQSPFREIAPGDLEVSWPDGWIHLDMPPGWMMVNGFLPTCCGWSAHAATTLTRYDLDVDSPTLTLNLDHDVTHVVADVCSDEERSVEIGPTAEDLTTALLDQVGVLRSGPTDLVLGGYPARKFVLTMPSDALHCPGSEAHQIWANGRHPPASGTTNGLSLVKDGTATIYVVDVHGDRLVITSLERGAAAEHAAELEAIVASIDIDGWVGDLPTGRHSLTVDGIPFSIDTTASTEDGWADFNGVSINKSTRGPQDAEGILYWTGLPDGPHTTACGPMRDLSATASATEIAAAVASAPGTQVVAKPVDVTVGGLPAKHVVIAVIDELGCDPGYFFSWHQRIGGPFWAGTSVGDMIDVWIVDVHGTRLFIASELRQTSSEDNPADQATWIPEREGLHQEMRRIVDSIEFE